MNANSKYPHLRLRDWPFRLVPDEDFCSFMADRTQLQSDVRTFLRNLSRRPTSSIHLMWAWFGAGKTHTLRYIEYLCCKELPNFVPVYTEFPKTPKHFLDLYSAFIGRIRMQVLNEAYEAVFTSKLREDTERELRFDFPDLASALMFLYVGNRDEQDTAIRWLRTDSREVRLLKTIGVSRAIASSEDALKVLAWIVRLRNLASRVKGGGETRVIWLIDEFQRIKDCREPLRLEINSCLHAAFNRCPNSFTMVISFTDQPQQKTLPYWFTPELKDRIGIEKPLLLPPLGRSEALEFVQDVLGHFRDSNGAPVNRCFPFADDTVEFIIDQIQALAKRAKRQGEPKPRTIMHFFNRVLEEADPLMENKRLGFIGRDFAKGVLDQISLPAEEK